MSDTGERIAAAARALIGAPFRLHGRDPRTGLDCVGLVALALRGGGIVADLDGYALRNASIAGLLAQVPPAFLRKVRSPRAAGDILMCRPGPAQHHLLVALDADAVVHAHAGLRRVVCQSGPLPWLIEHHWRARAHIKG